LTGDRKEFICSNIKNKEELKKINRKFENKENFAKTQRGRRGGDYQGTPLRGKGT